MATVASWNDIQKTNGNYWWHFFPTSYGMRINKKYLDNYDLVLTKDFSLENGVLFKSRDGKSFSNELLKIISDYYIN